MYKILGAGQDYKNNASRVWELLSIPNGDDNRYVELILGLNSREGLENLILTESQYLRQANVPLQTLLIRYPDDYSSLSPMQISDKEFFVTLIKNLGNQRKKRMVQFTDSQVLYENSRLIHRVLLDSKFRTKISPFFTAFWEKYPKIYAFATDDSMVSTAKPFDERQSGSHVVGYGWSEANSDNLQPEEDRSKYFLTTRTLGPVSPDKLGSENVKQISEQELEEFLAPKLLELRHSLDPVLLLVYHKAKVLAVVDKIARKRGQHHLPSSSWRQDFSGLLGFTQNSSSRHIPNGYRDDRRNSQSNRYQDNRQRQPHSVTVLDVHELLLQVVPYPAGGYFDSVEDMAKALGLDPTFNSADQLIHIWKKLAEGPDMKAAQHLISHIISSRHTEVEYDENGQPVQPQYCPDDWSDSDASDSD